MIYSRPKQLFEPGSAHQTYELITFLGNIFVHILHVCHSKLTCLVKICKCFTQKQSTKYPHIPKKKCFFFTTSWLQGSGIASIQCRQDFLKHLAQTLGVKFCLKKDGWSTVGLGGIVRVWWGLGILMEKVFFLFDPGWCIWRSNDAWCSWLITFCSKKVCPLEI